MKKHDLVFKCLGVSFFKIKTSQVSAMKYGLLGYSFSTLSES